MNGIRSIDDPVEAVGWVEQRSKAMALRKDEPALERDDPARALRLTSEERDWLSGFLVCRQVPDGTMPFEALDGFLTALVIGPTSAMASDYLPKIWGTADASVPAWDSEQQLRYFMSLLQKHWNAIAARGNAHAPHLPFMDHFGEEAPGQLWAEGFIAGVDLYEFAWAPLFENKRVSDTVPVIAALAKDGEPLPESMRAEIVNQLPDILHIIAAYWQNPSAFPSGPMRSAKTGRNEPCPCGSGKKYKKCCGGAQGPTIY